MQAFLPGELNLPPKKQFIKEWTSILVSSFGIEARREAKRIANEYYERLRRDEIWINDKYQVHKSIAESHGFGNDVELIHLSIKRRDKRAIHDWRELQLIKNMLCGNECEAFEIYPAESRLADTANQYHLWVLPKGAIVPCGFKGRAVVTESGHGAVQRPFEVAPTFTTGV